MSDYGFNFNASAVIDDKGKASVGVNFKDSDGFKFDTEEKGSIQEVLEKLSKKFMDEFNAEVARLNNTAEKKSTEKAEKASATPDMVKRLRRLEQENAKLRAEVEANSKKTLDENDKNVQERAAKASAKYKDPSYNKPGDDKAKPNQPGISAKPKPIRAKNIFDKDFVGFWEDFDEFADMFMSMGTRDYWLW